MELYTEYPNYVQPAWLADNKETKTDKKSENTTSDCDQFSSKPKVLVIEDDNISQHVVQFMLGQLGYEVTCVDNGTQALEIYSSYDLIISDLGLPDIDGITICNTIRERTFKNQVPIIALTANCFCKEACLEAGFNDFMTKPVEYEVLVRVTKKYLAKEV